MAPLLHGCDCPDAKARGFGALISEQYLTRDGKRWYGSRPLAICLYCNKVLHGGEWAWEDKG